MSVRLLAVIVAGFLIGALGGAALLVLSQGGQGPAVQTSGQALIGGPFTLVGRDGKPVTDQAFRGKYMLVFFGFTHCPDICPTSLFEISEVLHAMGKDADRVNAYFISVDPERDTTAAMKDYLSSFDPHLKGLTGSPDQVAKVTSTYRVYARKVPLKDGDYTMDHTALIYLMDRDGKFVAPFNLKRTPEEAAADLKRYL